MPVTYSAEPPPDAQGQQQPNDFGANFNAAFNNAASFDTANQTLPNGQPAGGFGATVGSAAGTALRTLGGAAVGAGIGSVVPGVGTLAGAGAGATGALAGGGLTSTLRHQVNSGQNPASPGRVAQTTLNTALPLAFPFMPQTGLAGAVGINGAVSGGADLANQALEKGPANVDFGQAGTAALTGAGLGGAAHGVGVGLGNLVKKQGGSAVEPNYLEPIDNQIQGQQQQPQGYPQLSTTKPQVLPPGVAPPSEVGMLRDMVARYASYRYFLPDSPETQALAQEIQKHGFDPNIAAEQYMQESGLHANNRFLQNYDTGNLSGRIDQATQGAQQQQAQNVHNSLQGVANYDGSAPQTPGVGQAILDQNRNAQRTINYDPGNVSGQIDQTVQGARQQQVQNLHNSLQGAINYDPGNISGSIDQTVQGARQQQAQNLNNSLRSAANYDVGNTAESMDQTVQQAIQAQNNNAQRTIRAAAHYTDGQVPETPYADGYQQYGQVGPEQDGLNIHEVLRQLHEGEIDLHDVQDWLDAQQHQNNELGQVIQQHQMPHTDFTGVSEIATPEADAAGRQFAANERVQQGQAAAQQAAQQAALVRTAEQTAQWAKQINEQIQQGQTQVAQQSLAAAKSMLDKQQRAILEFHLKALAGAQGIAQQAETQRIWEATPDGTQLQLFPNEGPNINPK